jgi:hypothetical protein
MIMTHVIVSEYSIVLVTQMTNQQASSPGFLRIKGGYGS